MTSAVESNAVQTGRILYLGTPISLLDSRVLTGCNTYHSSTVICQSVDFGALADETTSIADPGFAQSFVDRFRGLRSFVPYNGLKDEFADALHSAQGVGFQQVLLEAILAVEAAVSFAMHELGAVSYAAVRKRATDADLIWSSYAPKLSLGSASVALLGLLELLPIGHNSGRAGNATDFDTAFAALAKRAGRRRLAPSTAVIELAAQRRGIPCQVLGRQHLLLGQGVVQQHVYASMTGTSIAAQKVCVDKRQTNRRLMDLRLPVPPQIKVGSVDEAHAAAGKIGVPVVIKPLKGRKGSGVSVGLTSQDTIESAFRQVHKAGADVLIERFMPGVDHRLLVVGGRFTAAVKRLPPSVTGDGVSTVAALIETLNAEPYRDGFRGFPVTIDIEVEHHLAQAGVALDDILPEGRTLTLRSKANVSTGGTPIDVTDQVHPDNRALAERAATGIGLDVAGVDLLTSDISRSYRETGGVIIEVNARPGLDIHAWPMAGKSRDVGADVLQLSFPTGDNGRIPILAIAGDKGTGSTARVLDALMRGAGRSVALALRTSAFVDGKPAELTEAQQKQAPLILLRDPEIDTLVTTVSLRQAARRGLLLNDCSVTVVMDRAKTGVAEAFHAGLDIVDRATRDCVVVGSGNRLALQRLSAVEGRRLILVGERRNDPNLRAHLDAGHDAVTTAWHKGEVCISLMSGDSLLAEFPIDDAVVEKDKLSRKRLTHALMFAIGAAHGAGLSGAEIRAALSDACIVAPGSA